MSFNQKKKVIKHAKFTYSPLGKALQIQIKTIKNRGKKQIKAIEGHRKQLLKSYELIKKDFNINRDNVWLEEQNKFNELVEKNLMNFRI